MLLTNPKIYFSSISFLVPTTTKLFPFNAKGSPMPRSSTLDFHHKLLHWKLSCMKVAGNGPCLQLQHCLHFTAYSHFLFIFMLQGGWHYGLGDWRVVDSCSCGLGGCQGFEWVPVMFDGVLVYSLTWDIRVETGKCFIFKWLKWKCLVFRWLKDI